MTKQTHISLSRGQNIAFSCLFLTVFSKKYGTGYAVSTFISRVMGTTKLRLCRWIVEGTECQGSIQIFLNLKRGCVQSPPRSTPASIDFKVLCPDNSDYTRILDIIMSYQMPYDTILNVCCAKDLDEALLFSRIPLNVVQWRSCYFRGLPRCLKSIIRQRY